jgi:hypothetical protein
MRFLYNAGSNRGGALIQKLLIPKGNIFCAKDLINQISGSCMIGIISMDFFNA